VLKAWADKRTAEQPQPSNGLSGARERPKNCITNMKNNLTER